MKENEKLGQENAFPQIAEPYGHAPVYELGMSKRFYAATQVFCALISNADRHSQEGDCQSWNYRHLSEIAFSATDELLKQENK